MSSAGIAQSLVLFGASGDLARRKILPALYNLAHDGTLPERVAIVGYAASDWDDAAFRRHARRAVEEFSRRRPDPRRLDAFLGSLSYVAGRFDDPGCFGELEQRLRALERDRGLGAARLFYCATPPPTFTAIVTRIGECDLQRGGSIVLEKPIGHDLASARELDRVVRGVFEERQVFRIDHYLGKETVQNILVFRFANPMLARMWTRESIDHVQVTVAESIGIEGRGAYYERAGALRDMVQNHLLQVLAFLAMEPPRVLEPEALRDAKAEVLRAVRPFAPEDLVRGQYTWGVVEGREAAGYREQPDVAADSEVETFAAVRAWIDNERWRGVPFFLRTGKRLPRRATEVVLGLREAAECRLFEQAAALPPNHITLHLQPEEAISVTFRAKEPGRGRQIASVPMRFAYAGTFAEQPGEAYERLIADAMTGDQALFLREDGVERAWEIVEPALRAAGPVHRYPAGTWGPGAADDLIAPHTWHLP